jgi:hypothetical protein
MHLMKSSVMYFSIEVNLIKLYFCQIFLSGFAGKGVLNKDPTIWLDGARPVNTCIPPFFPGNVPAEPHSNRTPKNTFGSLTIIKFGEITFPIKRIRERVWLTYFGQH